MALIYISLRVTHDSWFANDSEKNFRENAQLDAVEGFAQAGDKIARWYIFKPKIPICFRVLHRKMLVFY
jgi:hypothetical protein